MAGTRFRLEVRPQIPKKLARLEDLANDLVYSWDRQIRSLFARVDLELWNLCQHNPKLFLRRVDQEKLHHAAEDRLFIEDYNRVLSAYDSYLVERETQSFQTVLDAKRDTVAYFCAEFGFHESFPIYSGGLGILAGDHCKAASDIGLPFVAIGLLYRQGYFKQTIDVEGKQIAHYTPTNFAELPISPALNKQGQEVRVSVELPNREVQLRVWMAKAGHIKVYLLDSDLAENALDDRRITYQLYGGDAHNRIQQEIILGIGGIRALRALEIRPTVWHINEGHSAFQILERCRVTLKLGIDFATAWECVAGSTVFTTHTPVAAGHDIFDTHTIETYFSNYINQLGISKEAFMALGSTPHHSNQFNMTALALRGSRFHNGVSRIHGEVASEMESYIWPQVPPKENPINYVTNGVHLPTFLAWEWANLFYRRMGGGWRNELCNEEFWSCIDEIPDHSYWSLHQSLKSVMLEEVNKRACLQHQRNGWSQAQVEKITRMVRSHENDYLILGFARRFATYKRATLLFSDLNRLKRILNDADRPVILIFAGKAHPNDVPGQELIKRIHDLSIQSDFLGKILLIEDYDLSLGRKLVSGVDVWINTPQYPLEASGTSGQKAGINGVINLSVLDGWWGEGYNEENGWAISPHDSSFEAQYRDKEESQDLLDILEHQVVPLYYERNGQGYSENWVKKSKASMKSIIPLFNAQRMVQDYTEDFYGPASQQHKLFVENNFAAAQELAQWKLKVHRAWSGVSIRRIDNSPEEIVTGYCLPIQVAVRLNGLDDNDVVVECLVGEETEDKDFLDHSCHRLNCSGQNENGEHLFNVDFMPSLPGLQFYKLRIFPHHRHLSHQFEMGYMLWL